MERRKIEDPIVESMRQTIERQSGQLVRIIDELLDVNRGARAIQHREIHHRPARGDPARCPETSRQSSMASTIR
jgi:hypothetical protein